MEFKGTKGKWIASNKSQTIVDEKGYGIVQITGILNESQWQHNALLISKAPELLEALKFMVSCTTKEFAEINGFGVARENAIKLLKEATELN